MISLTHIRNSVRGRTYLITETIQVLKTHHDYTINTSPCSVFVAVRIDNLASVVTPERVVRVNLVAV